MFTKAKNWWPLSFNLLSGEHKAAEYLRLKIKEDNYEETIGNLRDGFDICFCPECPDTGVR